MNTESLSTVMVHPDDEEIHLQIITLKGSGDLVFGGKEGMHLLLIEFCIALSGVNPTQNHISHEAICEVSEELKTRIFNFINSRATQLPQLHKLRQLFEKLDVGDYFFALPSKKEIKFATQEFHEICILLQSATSKIPVEELYEQYSNTFGDILSNYNIYGAHGQKSYLVGSIDKICRYCGRSAPEVSFRKKGHSISEALGNKMIITRDECDDCNQRFGKDIEESTIEYFNTHRVIFGIKGKNGIPDIVGKNYTLKKDESGRIQLSFSIPDEYAHLFEHEDKERPPKQIPLISNKKIVAQDIHRCLAKYAIGILPTNEVRPFAKTIQWINKKFDADELPKVAILTTYNFFDRHPSMLVYVRKSDDNTLPYAICEFHFTCLVIIAIIPTFEGESFGSDALYAGFWDRFHFNKVRNWYFTKFLHNSPKEFIISFNLEQNTLD